MDCTLLPTPRIAVIYDAKLSFAAPFQEVTYTDAVKILEKSGKKFEFPVAWGLDLQKEHEKYLVEVRHLSLFLYRAVLIKRAAG